MNNTYANGKRGQPGWSRVTEYDDGSKTIELIPQPNVVGAMLRDLHLRGEDIDQLIADWQRVNGRLL